MQQALPAKFGSMGIWHTHSQHVNYSTDIPIFEDTLPVNNLRLPDIGRCRYRRYTLRYRRRRRVYPVGMPTVALPHPAIRARIRRSRKQVTRTSAVDACKASQGCITTLPKGLTPGDFGWLPSEAWFMPGTTDRTA